jgi:hypothetical protein
MGRRHKRIQLGLAQLGSINIIRGRKNASCRTGLYNVSAIFNVESNREARLIGRVNDAVLRACFMIQQPEAESLSVVAVTSGRTY